MGQPERPESTAGRLAQLGLYHALRSALAVPQIAGAQRSREVAVKLGRAYGAASINRKRVDRAIDRVAVAMPGVEPDQRREIVLRSYEHLAALAVELAVIPRLLSEDGWVRHAEVGQIAGYLAEVLGPGPAIFVTGHCGNWEVVGYTMALLGFPMAALYRPLDLKPMDDWVRAARARRGLELVDKFGATKRLPEIMERGGVVGFVADQNAGDRGLQVPFFNRLASTYKTIGLLALKYRAPVLVGQARRLPHAQRRGGLGYRLEIEDVIRPDQWDQHQDPLFYLTARYRRAIETMVLRAPEQYLWMHRIWKSRPRHERADKPFPDALRRKLGTLPWLDDAGVESLVDRSDRDRAWLREQGTDRLN